MAAALTRQVIFGKNEPKNSIDLVTWLSLLKSRIFARGLARRSNRLPKPNKVRCNLIYIINKKTIQKTLILLMNALNYQ